MTLPGIHIKETVESTRKEEYNGSNILIIGNTGVQPASSQIDTLYNYENALKELKIDEKDENPASNVLLKSLGAIFMEGRPVDPNDLQGVNKVYVINIGPNPSNETLVEALKTSETLYDATIEVYPELSNIFLLNSVAEHLKKLEEHGIYRIAIATTPPDSSVEDIVKITNRKEDSHISSGRVVLHVDPDMLGFFAAKIACTPYYQDPAYKHYRSSKFLKIKKNYGPDELEQLLNAGLVVDWKIFDSTLGIEVVEPVYARATNYTAEKTPADAYLHQRLNADHQARVTDNIARRYIKKNNTEIARHEIEFECTAYLKKEVAESKLESFYYELYPHPNDPYVLIVKMGVKPVKSVHMIEINRLIQG